MVFEEKSKILEDGLINNMTSEQMREKTDQMMRYGIMNIL